MARRFSETWKNSQKISSKTSETLVRNSTKFSFKAGQNFHLKLCTILPKPKQNLSRSCTEFRSETYQKFRQKLLRNLVRIFVKNSAKCSLKTYQKISSKFLLETHSKFSQKIEIFFQKLAKNLARITLKTPFFWSFQSRKIQKIFQFEESKPQETGNSYNQSSDYFYRTYQKSKTTCSKNLGLKVLKHQELKRSVKAKIQKV